MEVQERPQELAANWKKSHSNLQSNSQPHSNLKLHSQPHSNCTPIALATHTPNTRSNRNPKCTIKRASIAVQHAAMHSTNRTPANTFQQTHSYNCTLACSNHTPNGTHSQWHTNCIATRAKGERKFTVGERTFTCGGTRGQSKSEGTLNPKRAEGERRLLDLLPNRIPNLLPRAFEPTATGLQTYCHKPPNLLQELQIVILNPFSIFQRQAGFHRNHLFCLHLSCWIKLMQKHS